MMPVENTRSVPTERNKTSKSRPIRASGIEFLTNSIPQMLTPRPVPQMRATLRKMVATRSGDVVSRTRAPLRSSDQRSHWNNHGWLSGRLDGALMGRLGPRLLGRLLLGEFQEHVFQGAVQRRLLPQHLQRPAADQPAA